MGYPGSGTLPWSLPPCSCRLCLTHRRPQDLVSRFTPDNYKINNGVLEVAHSIFVRWRPLYRSDALYAEINHVLGTFAVPFLKLLSVS